VQNCTTIEGITHSFEKRFYFYGKYRESCSKSYTFVDKKQSVYNATFHKTDWKQFPANECKLQVNLRPLGCYPQELDRKTKDQNQQYATQFQVRLGSRQTNGHRNLKNS
jgi:hypothetical protein